MATGPTGDRGQKKKRIVTLALMAIFLMSASFFLIDRKEETIIVVSFPNGRELEAKVAEYAGEAACRSRLSRSIAGEWWIAIYL